MVQTTSHIFSGKVEVESNLKVGSSHLFVDTENNRVGITTNDPHASLHVNGNAYVGTNFNVGTAIELNQVAGRVKATTFEGDGSLLTGVASTLSDVVNKGNVTSNTVQFTNTDTGIVTTGNVNIGNQLSVGGLTPSKFPYVNSDNTLVDSSISETTDTVVVSSNLEVTGNIVMSGQAYTIESESLKINDRIIGIANNNTLHGADIGMIMNHPTKNVALVHHGASGNPHNHELTIGYTQNTASDTTIVNDTANIITVNVLGHFVTQNNLTVGSGGSYYGDGTTLTGVALFSDMTSNAGRVDALETRATDLELANTVQSGLISGLETSINTKSLDDVVNVSNATSNTVQFTNTGTSLIASGTVEAAIFKGSGAQLTNIPPSAITGTLSQWSDGANNDVYVASNVGIGNVHTLTSNTLQVGANLYVRDAGANVLTVVGNVASTGKFLGDGTELTGVALKTDLAANVLRISDLENANIVQEGLITDLTSNLSSNASRISNLETSNDYIWSNISNLETSNDYIWSNISDLRTDVNANNVRITNLETDLAPIRTSTTGDIIYASATNTLNRLGIGSSGDVLSVSAGGIPEWSSGGTGGVWSTNAEGEIYFTTSNVGIANADPGHELSVGSNLYVDDDGSNVLVVSGNISADALTLGDVAIVPSYGLDAVTTESNITNQVVQFNHPTTGFVTASNAVVGGTLSIENFEIVQSYGLENVTNVNNSTEDTIISTNVTTGFQSTANISVGRDAIISGNVSIGGIMTMGTVNVVARHSLQGVTDMGNTTTHTIQFTNPTTSLVTSGNVEVGGVVHGYTKISATGGTESTTNAPGYTTHTFTSDGTFTVTTPGLVEYLIVAGGGSGGSGRTDNNTPGAGGGGGGVLSGKCFVATGSHAVVIGDGGASVSWGSGGGSGGINGGNSSFNGRVAIGGGGGRRNEIWTTSSNGGSGGGCAGGGSSQAGAVFNKSKDPGRGITGAIPQGNDGGRPYPDASNASGDNAAGGGGGAGSKGFDAYYAGAGVGGDGGYGVISTISGSSITYAGGGGGAGPTAGSGGSGGGGNGNNTNGNASSGTNGLGGGGGGQRGNGGGNSGAGGSGIVIIRYLS